MLKVLRIIILYIVFFVLCITVFAFLPISYAQFAPLVSLLVPAILVWLNERRIKKKRDLVEAEEFVARINNDKLAIREQVEKHLPALSRNMRKAVRINDYGATASDERILVVAEFLASTGVVLQQMSTIHAVSYIESLLEAEKTVRREETQFDPSLIPSNGYDFEHWVAEALEQFGWDARATQGSGDQGVDVIASREGLSLGIQCKLYSAAVGNKAVQEAFAGAKHMGLDKAAVLTNAAFTQSAKDLAASTGVLLLSPYDIPTLAEQFK